MKPSSLLDSCKLFENRIALLRRLYRVDSALCRRIWEKPHSQTANVLLRKIVHQIYFVRVEITFAIITSSDKKRLVGSRSALPRNCLSNTAIVPTSYRQPFVVFFSLASIFIHVYAWCLRLNTTTKNSALANCLCSPRKSSSFDDVSTLG